MSWTAWPAPGQSKAAPNAPIINRRMTITPPIARMMFQCPTMVANQTSPTNRLNGRVWCLDRHVRGASAPCVRAGGLRISTGIQCATAATIVGRRNPEIA